MFQRLPIAILIVVLIAPATCKEVAYVYGEGGGRVLENISFSERNESEILSYTVSSIGRTSKSYETNNTTSEIKEKIKQKINKGNRPVRTKGRELVGTISGASRIDQICSIYDGLVSVRNWTYIGDWTGLEELQSSDETLELGASSGILGKGDCDDFAILLAALIESVQGTSRIVFAYGPAGGHAYAQVYLGSVDEGDVYRMHEWLKLKYDAEEIFVTKDEETGDVWLNLDWWRDPKTRTDLSKHPGGPFFLANNHTPVYYSIEKESWTSLTPVPEPPLAKFSISKADPNALEDVTFDGSESRDLDSDIKEWDWDFGDGKKDKGRSVVHSYSKGGSYNVTLTVTDNDDVEKSSQYIQIIDVNGLPIPVISFTPKYPKITDAIDFDSSQSRDSDPGGNIRKYKWDFGDGTTSTRSHFSPQKYENNGSYNVSLKVEDDKGAVNTTYIIIKVNMPPVAALSIEPPLPSNRLYDAGDKIEFDASDSKDSDGNITGWKWDFGDKTNASGKQVSHIYHDWGEFSVVLNVTDEDNAYTEIEVPLKVNARPIANFTFNPANPEKDVKISFDASSSIDFDDGIDKYEWDFVEEEKIRKIPDADYTYERAGEYNVTLTVHDKNGATNSTNKKVIVKEAYQIIEDIDNFSFAEWGSFKTKGSFDEKYFTGYVFNESLPAADQIPLQASTDDVLSNGQRLKILSNDNTERTLTSNSPLELKEDYELALKFIDIDGNKVYLELTKNDDVIDSKVISPSADNAEMRDKTYYYKKDIGTSKDVVIIAVHFKNAFRGADQDIATVDGIWQLSESETSISPSFESPSIGSPSFEDVFAI